MCLKLYICIWTVYCVCSCENSNRVGFKSSAFLILLFASCSCLLFLLWFSEMFGIRWCEFGNLIKLSLVLGDFHFFPSLINCMTMKISRPLSGANTQNLSSFSVQPVYFHYHLDKTANAFNISNISPPEPKHRRLNCNLDSYMLREHNISA